MPHEVVCSYNCVDLPGHEQVECGDFPKGGIASLGILECDHTITDFSNATQVQAAIDAGDLKLIEPVRAILPESTEVEGVNPNACGSETILDGFDFTLTWQDFNVTSNNDSVYEALNLRQNYLIWFECETDMIRVVDFSPVSFVSKLTTPESNKEKQFYAVTAKWSSAPNEFPQLFDAPPGIFQQN